jgi:excinuclease ABC subunit C
MPIGELKDQIARLPEQPGVYLFSNPAGETIYVGKASALRDRVRSYLGAYGSNPKTDALLDEVGSLDVIVTDSVVEALALENNLIKQRQPKYNILLRDDKNYPFLKLTTGESCPRVLVARRVERDGHVYAGPFLPASLARRTMALTHRLFGIRSCNEEITGKRGRPCLEYDIKRCIAPCVDTLCSPEEYAQAVQDARLFLEGRTEELAAALRTRMEAAASAERFEEAASLRDALRIISALADRQQKIATPDLRDRDTFGVHVGPAGAVIQVFQVRRGRVIERVELVTAAGDAAQTEAGLLGAAIQQFYDLREIPPVVHVAVEPGDLDMLETWLSTRAGRRTRVLVPRRGEARGLLGLASRNAAIAYRTRFREPGGEHEALESLREWLALPARPRRIETFDISTIQGRDTVASMVVVEDGRLKRSEYRKYKIRGQGPGARGQGPGTKGRGPGARGRGPGLEGRGPDDTAAMQQVVGRRYRGLLEQGGPFPDLVVVDGGRGQVSAAYAALEQLGLANLVVIGLAKREELVVTRDRPNPLAWPAASPALRFLQRLRDEAHRSAVTFHRRRRSSRDFSSELDDISGVGRRRRQALLSAFGSLAGVRRASQEQLAAVVGRRVAAAVLAHFEEQRGTRL